MGKLGKKARKFAKKNLQSVLRKNRKLNSKFKKKRSSRDEANIEGPENDAIELSTIRETSTEQEDTSLEIVSSEEDSHFVEDDSDSDGYLSEEQSCLHASGNTNKSHAEDSSAAAAPSAQNQNIQSELIEQRRKLERLKKKVAVQLWVTGRGTLSSAAFLIFRDSEAMFGSDCYDMCLSKMFKAFMACCNVKEPVNLEHIRSLRDFFIEFCSLNLQKSVSLAMASTQRLARILHIALRTKKEEALKKLCSWEYVLCIDVWVAFLSTNKDDNLHGLLFMVIQIINGVVNLFSGPRYMPLRIRCIQWLNRLSSSSGVFIPVSQLVLDALEFKAGKEVGKPGKAADFSTALKLPKYWLKSQNFQEECIYTAVELLSAHFAQWSYHISFPELATIPLIRLRKFHEKSTVDSHSNVVKRLIDLVEKNIDFVQRKRDETSFAPREQQSVDYFLQFEMGRDNAPFTESYESIMQKAALRRTDGKSSNEKKRSKRRKRPFLRKKKAGDKDSGKQPVEPSIEETDVKMKKRKINVTT